MPLYEYECESCGHRFELIQKFTDAPASSCPKCTGAVRKLLSSPAIQFKGTGWYITDYARKPSGGQASGKASDSGEKGDKKDKSTTKTGDSKAKTSSSKSSSSSSPK